MNEHDNARIAQLEHDLKSLARSCEIRADSPRISQSESGTLKWVALEIHKALDPDTYRADETDEDF